MGRKGKEDSDATSHRTNVTIALSNDTKKSIDSLKKDLKKVSQANAKHKYVFFACPGYQPGEQDEDSDYPGVKIISIGIDFQKSPTMT